MTGSNAPRIHAIKISPNDNVATCLQEIDAGTLVSVKSRERDLSVTAVDSIPRGHKIALGDIAMGDAIFKYGEVIGRASSSISIGCHVHSQNVVD